MTKSQQLIYDFLEYNAKEWFSPTYIAQCVKGSHWHSAWSSPICISLVSLCPNEIRRNKKGWYRYYRRKIKPDSIDQN